MHNWDWEKHWKNEGKRIREIENAIKDNFGVDVANLPLDLRSRTAHNFFLNLQLLHTPIEEAIFKTDNPEIKVSELKDAYLESKFHIMKKGRNGEYQHIEPDFLLFSNKNEVSLTATLEKVRKACYFGHQNRNEDSQDVSNLYGNISHAYEFFEHGADGTVRQILRIFDENGLAEERIIEEYKTNVTDGPATCNLTVRRTDDGAKVSVEYQTKD
jgi:hypothetical protein